MAVKGEVVHMQAGKQAGTQISVICIRNASCHVLLVASRLIAVRYDMTWRGFLVMWHGAAW